MKLYKILKIIILSILSGGCKDSQNNDTDFIITTGETTEISPTTGEFCDCNFGEFSCNDCMKDRLVFVTPETFTLFDIQKINGDNFKDIFEKICKDSVKTSQLSIDFPEILNKKWNAFVSYENFTAFETLEKDSGIYKLIDDTIIAMNKEDLLDGIIDAPINKTLDGEVLENRDVWTGSEANGLSAENCKNWMKLSENAVVGNTNEVLWEWANNKLVNCKITTASIYCFERLHN